MQLLLPCIFSSLFFKELVTPICIVRVVEYSRNGFFDCSLSEAQKRTWFPLGHYFVLTLTDSRYAYVTSSNHWVLTATYFFQWASVELVVTYFSSLLWVTLLAMYSILQAAKLGWEYITVSNKTNLECLSTYEYSPALASLRRFFSLYFFKKLFCCEIPAITELLLSLWFHISTPHCIPH